MVDIVLSVEETKELENRGFIVKNEYLIVYDDEGYYIVGKVLDEGFHLELNVKGDEE